MLTSPGIMTVLGWEEKTDTGAQFFREMRNEIQAVDDFKKK